MTSPVHSIGSLLAGTEIGFSNQGSTFNNTVTSQLMLVQRLVVLAKAYRCFSTEDRVNDGILHRSF